MKISENWLRSWVNPAIDSETLSNLAGGFKETWGLPFKSAQFKFID